VYISNIRVHTLCLPSFPTPSCVRVTFFLFLSFLPFSSLSFTGESKKCAPKPRAKLALGQITPSSATPRSLCGNRMYCDKSRTQDYLYDCEASDTKEKEREREREDYRFSMITCRFDETLQPLHFFLSSFLFFFFLTSARVPVSSDLLQKRIRACTRHFFLSSFLRTYTRNQFERREKRRSVHSRACPKDVTCPMYSSLTCTPTRNTQMRTNRHTTDFEKS